jgi:hypothetical protein
MAHVSHTYIPGVYNTLAPYQFFLIPELTAFLVPRDELVMKPYMHVQLAIIETHCHNLNANIKNQDYWLVT